MTDGNTKYCPWCDTTKDIEEFGVRRTGKVDLFCRACGEKYDGHLPDYHKHYAKANREKLKQQKTNWRLNHKAEHAASNKASYARKMAERDAGLRQLGLPTPAEARAQNRKLKQLKAADPAEYEARMQEEKVRAFDTLLEIQFPGIADKLC